MKIKQLILIIKVLFFLIIVSNIVIGQDKSDWEGEFPDGCTSITVGKLASADGSVFTSHTDDSHRTRSWIDIVAAKDHDPGSVSIMYKRVSEDSGAMPMYRHDEKF